ncbi:N-6 DNA methylase [Lysobacter firmicutimachus]|uniref:N-6 DNA methylase n=1 Tax=Lysobacter firmicutimachus TaxID=1792846 RepID=A0ABU8CZ29_9GAMM
MMDRRRSDRLGRYYTQETIAALLVSSMNVTAPKTVIDLGAGDGTLIGEAAKRWRAARYVTVDIDAGAGSGRLPTLHGSAFRHYTGDALDSRLSDHLGVPWGDACVAVCNPPYIKPRWRQHFRSILEDVGLDHVLPRAEDIPADVLFVAQNLRLLKKGGRLGLIIPDGLVAGERFAAFRRTLVERHAIDQVIELPRNIFSRTEAKAHIVVLTKATAQRADIAVRKLEPAGQLSSPMLVAPERAIQRLDYSYYTALAVPPTKRRRSPVRLADLTRSVERGNYSSRSLRDVTFPVFHTTHLLEGVEKVPRSFVLPKIHRNRVNGVTARTGDILVARVGRNLSKKICQVARGPVVVSDCFLVVRANPGDRDRLFALLTSSRGRAALDAVAHGVGARFITPSALLGLSL